MSSALLRHVWGVSRGADRVWAQVTGLRPEQAGDRLFMVFQAFLDDSRKDDFFVLAGYLASAERWAAFAEDWERLLPLAKLGTSGKRRFKMREMFVSDEGKEDTAAFYRVIEDHVAGAISITLRISEMERAMARVRVDGEPIGWPGWTPYHYAFRALMDGLHGEKHVFNELMPIDEPIDFIFDRQAEASTLLSLWDRYVESAPPDIRKRYGSMPRFEDDEDFLPLQAADLWAWAVRWWAENGIPEKAVNPDFGKWGSKRVGPLVVRINATEDGMAHYFVEIARRRFASECVPVSDANAND